MEILKQSIRGAFAIVPDALWLIEMVDEEEGDGTDDAKIKKVQANQIHGKDISL